MLQKVASQIHLKVFFMRMIVQANLDLRNLLFSCLNCLIFDLRKNEANLKLWQQKKMSLADC